MRRPRPVILDVLKRLLPPACPLCSQTLPLSWPEPFCADCFARLEPLPPARCNRCALPFVATENSAHLCARCLRQPPEFEVVHALGLYQGMLRTAIHQFKFNNRVLLDRALGKLLNRVIPQEAEYDLLVAVPLARQRLQQRSFNQSLLLARELARLRQRPVVADLLKKAQETVPQHGLSATARQQNLRDVFQCCRQLSGERILLIDDVMTTGATLRACSQVLCRAGAGEVQAAVLARA